MTAASGLDAEEVAVLCLLVADGDLACSCADVADLLNAIERRARSVFGPVPDAMRRALVGLVLEAGLADPKEVLEGGVEAALARIALRDALPPMLSRDRLWFAADGGVHWTAAAPGALAASGSRHRAARLLALVAAGPTPKMVLSTLDRLGWDRSFIRALLEPGRSSEPDDLRRQVAWQDWFE